MGCVGAKAQPLAGEKKEKNIMRGLASVSSWGEGGGKKNQKVWGVGEAAAGKKKSKPRRGWRLVLCEGEEEKKIIRGCVWGAIWLG